MELMVMPQTPESKLFQPAMIGLAASALLAVLGFTDALAEAGPEPSRAAVFADHLPGFDESLAREISGQVQAAGYATEFISATVLTNPALLTARRYDLLVLPGARALPMAAAPAITRYLQEGGDLLALGLPAWQSPLYQIKGKWVSRESYEAEVAAQRPQHIVEDFDRADLARWSRSAGDASGKAEYELTDVESGKPPHAASGRPAGALPPGTYSGAPIGSRKAFAATRERRCFFQAQVWRPGGSELSRAQWRPCPA